MNKILQRASFILILVVFSFSDLTGAGTQQYQSILSGKKETMKNVLQALEEGTDYDSMPNWREKTYGFSFHPLDHEYFDFDLDWEFPEINIDEEYFEDIGRRLEIIERKMQEKMQELEKKIDSLNQRLSRNYQSLV